MNIVCVSHNLPPDNNAEALCTGRLLTALRKAGHNVHAICSNKKATLDSKIAAEILDPTIAIYSVKPLEGRVARLSSIARYLFHGEAAEWILPAIKKTIEVLKSVDNPILITRSFPIVSNIVGYYCRDNCRAWIPHFSDPYPPFEWKNHWYSPLARPLNRRWANRIINSSTHVTVTCQNAIRYIKEKTDISLEGRFSVLPHLALPEIKRGSYKLDKKKDEFVIAHIGNLMTRRKPMQLFKGVMDAIKSNPSIRFLQYGHVDADIMKWIQAQQMQENFEIKNIENLCPRKANDLQRQVDVNVIIDTDLGLSYSPFILSKYPHAVCARKPLLMISSLDSEMNRMTELYGGGEFVPFDDTPGVTKAILKQYEEKQQAEVKVPSFEYMEMFSERSIINSFVEILGKCRLEK